MKKNIYIFYVLAFLQGLVFYSSVATLYRTTHGISLYEMGIIEGAMALFIILFELPWGIIADRIGYKKTMIICNFLYFLSKVVFYLANSFILFLLERFLLALSFSGLSGCDTSLLYLSTNKEDIEKVFGIQAMLSALGMIISSLVFSLFMKENIDLSALATIYPYCIAFILTFFLDDIHDNQKSVISLKSIFQSMKNNKMFLLVLIAAVLLTESTHTLTVFYNQLQYERVGIGIEYYGIIYMVMQILGMSSGLLGRVTRHFSKEKLMIVLFAVASVTSILLVYITTPIMSILMLMILTCVETMFYPLLTIIQNENVSNNARATSLSIYSLFSQFITIIMNVSFGKVVSISLINSYYLAFFFCFLGLCLFVIWKKVCNK